MQPTPNVLGAPANGLLGRWGGSKYNRLNPTAIANLAAWYDVSSDASTTSDLLRIDASNRVSLIADRSGNSGTNCLCLNGAASNYGSAPDSAALSITGDVRLEWFGRLSSWASGARQVLVSKWNSTGNQRSYWLAVTSTGALEFVQSTDGSASSTFTSSATLGLSAFASKWVRATLDVDNGAAGRTVTFETSDDGVSWSALGTAQTVATAANTFDSTATLNVGGNDAGAFNLPTGNVFRVRIYSTPLGAPGLAFDANFALAGKLVSSFTESSSNAATVTINSSGDLGARICGERDLVQLTASKQPIYLPWSGTNYGWTSTAGSYYSTPDAAVLDITGDVDLRAFVAMADWTPAAIEGLVAKNADTGNQISYRLDVNTNGTLRFGWSTDGTTPGRTFVSSSVAPTVADGAPLWVRATLDVDNGSGQHEVRFWTSSDGSTWSQLGTTYTGAGTTSVFAGTAPLEVGSINAATSARFTGRFFRAQVLNGINGTVVADFDPSRYTSGTTFTASTGETWTLNGGATIVTNTSLYFDGTDDYMKAAAFSLSQPETVYFVGQQVSWTSTDVIFGGNADNDGNLYQKASSPNLGLNAGALLGDNGNLAIGATGVVTSIFNGASSALRVNRGTAVTGNAGTTAANGFTLACRGAGTTILANQRTNEVAIYAAAHDTATVDRWALYASAKWRISGV